MGWLADVIESWFRELKDLGFINVSIVDAEIKLKERLKDEGVQRVA